jgi:hypothetical protein
MGTELQVVYDNFFRHVPEVDFTYQQDQVYGFLKDSLGYIDDTVPEDLTYTIEENNAVLIIGSQAEKDGDIKITIQDSATHEYIVLVLTTDTKAMFRGYHDKIIVSLELYKQHIGTEDINKLPDNIKYQMSNSLKALELFDNHLEKLEQKFNEYTY